MGLIRGNPDLKFILKKSGVADVTVELEIFSEFEEDFEKIWIRHELETDEVRSKFKGYRYHANIYFEKVPGEELSKLEKILTPNSYDQLLFYPYSADNPAYYIDVVLDDETIKWSFYYLLTHKEFNIGFVGRNKFDGTPTMSNEFLNWSNITLQFAVLTMEYSTLD